MKVVFHLARVRKQGTLEISGLLERFDGLS